MSARTSITAAHELSDEWRQSANVLRYYGASGPADALDACAVELESALQAADCAPLTIAEAARMSGYSEDHLGRLLRQDKLPNAGRKGSPRIRRADVPTKPGHVAPSSANPELGIEQIVRSVIDEGVG